jgi:hypothetical protein
MSLFDAEQDELGGAGASLTTPLDYQSRGGGR